MADFRIERIRFNWKGSWTASTNYIKDDIVLYRGKAYVCLVTHTSDSTYFYTDLEYTTESPLVADAKWELMLDGYEWKGNWSASTYYTPGDIVKYKGYVYKCTDNHTSTSTVSLGLPGNISNWTLIATTYNWLNDWTVSTYYDLGDVVNYRGITYICSTKHTSATTLALGLEAHQASWTVVTVSDSWYANWTVNRRYKVNDVVKYSGTTYRCIVGHTSAANTTLGLEADQAKWEIVFSGVEYKSHWAISTRYKLNDIIKWSNSLWICTTYHTSGTTNLRDDESNWTEWLPGLGYEDVWSSSEEYKKGDIVLYGGYAYLALTNNTASIPSINGILQDTGDWELLKQGYNHRGEWSISESYLTGDVVRNNGYLYYANADSSGEYPDLEVSWTKLVKGTFWKNTWEIGHQYYIGDIVTLAGTTYHCIARHVSTGGLDNPLTDVAGAGLYWETLIQGTAGNVLTTIGDIRTHDGVNTTRHAIGLPGQALKVVNDAVAWNVFDNTNKVYFVSYENGSDQETAGLTTNLPFKTIKYAMEYILEDEASRAPATVFVKTGIYEEQLPIVIPASVSLVGDELRSVTVIPAVGYETSNMFYVRNATSLQNLTLQGLIGTLGVEGEYNSKRPSAGAYVSLDPGTGPNDSSTWITTRSPYVQRVSTFGTACVGLKIDGTLHNGGNKTIVANDFTQIINDGIAIWANGSGKVELVSVFTYYAYIGYLSTNGGVIRSANGNNSYGTFGSRAEGVDATETPITAQVDNKTLQAQIDRTHTNGSNIIALAYSNAGENYSSASLTFIGSGYGVNSSIEEFRNGAISNIRVLGQADSSIPGGLNYQYLRNYAQDGNTESITFAGSDLTGTSEKYVGMRVFIVSGKGIGQYGKITNYDDVSKVAEISRESDGALGWDHIYPGYPIEPLLDGSTLYSIEPRVFIPEPSFTPELITGPSDSNWKFIMNGNKLVTVTAGGTGTVYVSTSTDDGSTWSEPSSLGTDFVVNNVLYTGSKYIVVKQENNLGAAVAELLQSDNGDTWSTITLPSTKIWKGIASTGTGELILSSADGEVLISYNNGTSWSVSANLSTTTETWNSAAYGNNTYVVNDNSGTGSIAYSKDGALTFTTITPLSAKNWGDMRYGNGRFVTVDDNNNTAYSFDGITWYESSINSLTTLSVLSYDSGEFLATGLGNILAKSKDGKIWKTASSGDFPGLYNTTVSNDWGQLARSGEKIILTATGSTSWNTIETGSRAIVRAVVDSSRISAFLVYDPGSYYLGTPAITIIDPENTIDGSFEVAVANGVLTQPVFYNRGTGYNLASCTVAGNGNANEHQLGNYLKVKNLSTEPGPGDNLLISGIDDQVYRVVSTTNISGIAPNLTATIRITPSIAALESPDDETTITIRQKYSQVRLTGHDFLDIGSGNFENTDYPDRYGTSYYTAPEGIQPQETTEIGGGRVFYTSTDQDGNFRVGELFRVDQATGIVSVSSEFFDISGLNEISLGGLAVGASPVIIREFSKEGTFVANSNNIVPTQAAIIRYLSGRITSGGSNANTTTLIAGKVKVNSNRLTTTTGERIDIVGPTKFSSAAAGKYLALQYFTFGQKLN